MSDTLIIGLLVFILAALLYLIITHIETARHKTSAILDRTTFDQQRELLGVLWLYTNWRYITKNLTTPQKELWADAIDEWHVSQGYEHSKVERWWRE